MDYEGEEGEEGSDQEQEDVAENEQKDAGDAQETAEEESGESPNSTEQPQETSQESMRINTVLQLSTAMEEYKYDTVNGLWCEVCTNDFVGLSRSSFTHFMLFRDALTPVLVKNASVSQLTLALPITKVHFDLTSVVVKQAQNSVVMETKGITRCLLNEVTTKEGTKEMVLNTEGINMHEMFKHADVSLIQSITMNTSGIVYFL